MKIENVGKEASYPSNISFLAVVTDKGKSYDEVDWLCLIFYVTPNIEQNAIKINRINL